MALSLILLTLGLAFANGANDVSKGVATLVGAGLTSERRAMAWGTAWTLLGVTAAMYASQGLIQMFSGKGLLEAPPLTLAWPAAAAAGVIGWLVLATRAGLPVSTTHALVGAIVGAGLVAAGPNGVRWGALSHSVAIPLLLSPVLSLAVVFGTLPPVTGLFRRLSGYCVCVERTAMVPAVVGLGPRPPMERGLHLIAGEACPPQVMTRLNALDSLHWLTAGLTSFARGMNDAPKIVALGLAAGTTLGLGASPMLALVAAAMGAGSYLAGRRVTGTLATTVTPMTGPEALTANGATSILVGLASLFGMPVSTTHVSTGTVIAIGLHRREVRWRVVGEMLLAWLVTLPVAAAFAAATYAAFR
ncbi:MAG: inorganic phosphate transporter [Gemmatimonadota bacterium]|nr:inorganic phosphate transporter [Gemmatimonadota bacterium]